MTRFAHRAFTLGGTPAATLAGAVAIAVVLVVPVPARDVPDPATFWLAPATAPTRPTPIAAAVQQLADGKAAAALPVFEKTTSDTAIGLHALLYLGRAQLTLGRAPDAMVSARKLVDAGVTGFLRESALWLAADAAVAAADWPGAVLALTSLIAMAPLDPASAHYRLGVAAAGAGDSDLAWRSFRRVYYEFPLSDEAAKAESELTRLKPVAPPALAEQIRLELGRAQILSGARRFADAKKGLAAIRPLASGDDLALVELKFAQTDVGLKRFAAAREMLSAQIDRGTSRMQEAQVSYFATLRGLGRHVEYVSAVEAFAAATADSVWVETALSDLATHYILIDDDGKAAEVLTEQYRRFPLGPNAGRAAWKAGWWAYQQANYAETIRLFESAAVGLRRSDYRSAWVYWAARAHGRLNHREQAIAGYRQTIADYRNSYYGREAARELDRLLAVGRPAGAGPVAPERRAAPLEFVTGRPPANADLVRTLLAAQLYADATGELRRTQRDEGSRPLLDATLAYALHHQGELRPAITAMKRAYPQYMAAGGEALPVELLEVLFPVAYWDQVQKHAAARALDPFLVAALIAQESTFDANVKSSANAWGLMQILPSTGRSHARTLGIRPFSTARLTQPEVNLRIGTTHLATLLKRFGELAPALAAYNAGEHRVVRWLAEHPGADRDEFIDGIPFPETQGYVRKIIGTAEDYRVLYRRSGTVAPAVRK